MKPFAALLLLLLSLAPPAFADNPAMGPYGSSVVWGPEITSPLVAASTLRLKTVSPAESYWQTAMRDAGICSLMFLHDGSGIRLSFAPPGETCIVGTYGPVISFPEFRRRMEAP